VTRDIGPEPVRIHADGTVLDGDLILPPQPESVVLFAHGSGSSRHSPRNRHVAAAVNRAGFATLLIDLLTPEEERLDARTGEVRFDIPRLAERLTAAVDWLNDHSTTATLPTYLFGASTGAAAALITAAERDSRTAGVISRGGRADLAGDVLHRVHAPVLLIAGGADPVVCQLDSEAAETLRGAGTEAEQVVVANATHLFEEPGALDAVIDATLQRLSRWQQAGVR
jgi:putative phosphoribosyl transferase